MRLELATSCVTVVAEPSSAEYDDLLSSSFPAPVAAIRTLALTATVCDDSLPRGGTKLGTVLDPRVRQVLFDEFAEAQAFVQLPNQNQTSF
jgi:hypothetical protein